MTSRVSCCIRVVASVEELRSGEGRLFAFLYARDEASWVLQSF